MNNLIIAKNYETFGEEGLTSNKVIYYKEDNMVKFRANITDNPFGESEVVTVGGDLYTLGKALVGEVDEVVLPLGLNSMYFLFNQNKTIRKVTIPNEYGNFANDSMFNGCSDLEEVILPSNLTAIGGNLFRGCRKIKSIILPSTVESIASYAFYGSGLEYIEISNSVNNISVQAFTNSNLGDVNFGNTRTTIPTITNNTFYNVKGTLRIIVPDALYDQWIAATNWSDYADKIVKYSDVYPVYYDYLENDNNRAYIDTGIKGIGKLKAEGKFLFNNLGAWGAIGGVRVGVNGRCYLFGYGNLSNMMGFVNGYLNNYTLLTPNTRCLANTIYEGSVSLDDGLQSYTINDTAFNPVNTEGKLNYNYNIWLYGLNYIENTNYWTNAKIWYFKIYQNDVLVRDYKPCFYNGEAGLWDSVECKFYGNANNTGTLTVGNDG